MGFIPRIQWNCSSIIFNTFFSIDSLCSRTDVVLVYSDSFNQMDIHNAVEKSYYAQNIKKNNTLVNKMEDTMPYRKVFDIPAVIASIVSSSGIYASISQHLPTIVLIISGTLGIINILWLIYKFASNWRGWKPWKKK